MRLNILWKLILTIALPLLGIYIVVNIFEFRSLRTQAIRDVNERVTRLATLYAQQFEGELQTFAQIAESAAEFLSIDPDLGRRDPWTILEKNIAQNRLVYGSALAWIPDAEHPEPASPFVFRSTDGGTRRIDIATEAYDYHQDWFTADRATASGPSPTSTRAGNILTTTFATPVRAPKTGHRRHDGGPSLEPLQQAMQLDELNQGVFMIISREDRFISHPDPGMIMEVKLQDLIEQHGNRTGMRELYERIRSENTGASGTPLLIGDVPYWIAFAPIPSTQWSLIAAFPSADVLAPVYNDLYRDVLSVGIGLLANLVAIFILALLYPPHPPPLHGDGHRHTRSWTLVEESNPRRVRGPGRASGCPRPAHHRRPRLRADPATSSTELNMAREIQARSCRTTGRFPTAPASSSPPPTFRPARSPVTSTTTGCATTGRGVRDRRRIRQGCGRVLHGHPPHDPEPESETRTPS